MLAYIYWIAIIESAIIFALPKTIILFFSDNKKQSIPPITKHSISLRRDEISSMFQPLRMTENVIKPIKIIAGIQYIFFFVPPILCFFNTK